MHIFHQAFYRQIIPFNMNNSNKALAKFFAENTCTMYPLLFSSFFFRNDQEIRHLWNNLCIEFLHF